MTNLINPLAHYQVYTYGNGIIVLNNKTELAFKKPIYEEFSLLGGSVFQRAKIETFIKDNPDHKVDWIKNPSKREHPENPRFYCMIFGNYKGKARPIIEAHCAKMKDPKRDPQTAANKLKALRDKYTKPKKQDKKSPSKKTTAKSDQNKINELTKQVAEMTALLEKLKA